MIDYTNTEEAARYQGFFQWTEELNQSGIHENWRFDIQNPFFFAEAEAKRLPIREDHVRFFASYDSKREWFAMKDEWKHLADAQWAYADGDMLMFEDHLAIAQEYREEAEAWDRAEQRELVSS